jgi:hypothetical protein
LHLIGNGDVASLVFFAAWAIVALAGAPFPSDEMTCWPVSARVGNVRNNDASLIEPIAA